MKQIPGREARVKLKQRVIPTAIGIENGKKEIKVRRKTVVKSVSDRHLIQLS